MTRGTENGGNGAHLGSTIQPPIRPEATLTGGTSPGRGSKRANVQGRRPRHRPQHDPTPRDHTERQRPVTSRVKGRTQFVS